jgi:Uma2 family endonuclease
MNKRGEMAAAAEPLLMTVEQYRQLPHRDDVIQELHWGQVVILTFPKKTHTKLQSRFLDLLRPHAEARGLVAVEFPFRAVPEYELRAADVAFVSQQRWDATEEDDNLHGAPELVIEVLSPSNTATEIREKAALCLANGAEEFWVVDAKRKRVTVMRRQGGTLLYEIGDRIPLALFDGEIEVAKIFRP